MEFWIYTDKDGKKQFGQGGVPPSGAKSVTEKAWNAAIVEAQKPAIIPDYIPTITPRQLRLWLLSRGLLAQVPMLIDAMPEPDKSVAQIEWEFATVFDHNNLLVMALGSAVGLSSDDIEAGFREAALL